MDTHRRLGTFVTTIALLAVMAGTAVAAPPGPAATGAEPAAAPDQLLVGYVPGTPAAERARIREANGGRLLERVVAAQGDRLEVELVAIPRGSDRSRAERRFEASRHVAYAEPNWVLDVEAGSDDPYFTQGSLWGMYGDASSPANEFGSQAAEAWAAGQTGSRAVYIGVIDTGIDVRHPDLDANIWVNPFDPVDGKDNDRNGLVDDVHGWDFHHGDNTVYDSSTDDRHGTHVAGTIGAERNGSGVVGVNWDVTLIAGKFLGPSGGYTSNAVKAVNYFTDLKSRHGLDIVATNNSWGGGGYSQTLYDAIAAAGRADILFIAAAGNGSADNDATPRYPSGYDLPNIVAVAALVSDGAKASYSNWGATAVDLGAPGSGIWSTIPDNGYASFNGTSMATPHVTGAAALAAAHGTLRGDLLRQAVLDATAATPSLAGLVLTGGRLDISTLLGSATAPTPEPEPEPEPAPEPELEPVALTIGTVTPNTVTAGATVVDISGTGFVAGTTVTIEGGKGPNPTTSATTVSADGTSLQVTVTVSSSGPKGSNAFDVRVTRPDGASAVASRVLTVKR